MLTGPAPGQFAFTGNCGKSLVGHATCTIKLTKPTTKGAKSATLNVNGGGGGLRSVHLLATGLKKGRRRSYKAALRSWRRGFGA